MAGVRGHLVVHVFILIRLQTVFEVLIIELLISSLS